MKLIYHFTVFLLLGIKLIFAQDSTAVVTLTNNVDMVIKIREVKEYGLILNDNRTISFKVISKLKIKNNAMADEIIKYKKFTNYVKDDDITTIYVKLESLFVAKQTTLRVIDFKSTNFLFATDENYRYNINLDFSPHLLSFLLIKIGISAGFANSETQNYLPSFNFGLGYAWEFKKIRLNSAILYMRSFNPNSMRADNNDLGGDDMLGLDLNAQYLLGESKKYSIILGIMHSFDGYSFTKKQNQFNFYIGFGLNYFDSECN